MSGPKQSRTPAGAAELDLSKSALRVLMKIGEHTDRGGRGWCTRSVRRMAAELGCSDRTVRRAIRELQDAGLLVVRGNLNNGGGTGASSYRLTQACGQGELPLDHTARRTLYVDGRRRERPAGDPTSRAHLAAEARGTVDRDWADLEERQGSILSGGGDSPCPGGMTASVTPFQTNPSKRSDPDGSARPGQARDAREESRVSNPGSPTPPEPESRPPPDIVVLPASTPEEREARRLAEESTIVPDAKTTLFRQGLAYLAAATGKPPDRLRPLLGRWLKSTGDDAAALVDLLSGAQRERVADPIAWVEARLRSPPKRGRERPPPGGWRDPPEIARDQTVVMFPNVPKPPPKGKRGLHARPRKPDRRRSAAAANAAAYDRLAARLGLAGAEDVPGGRDDGS